MEFIEMPVFTQWIQELLNDEDYADLQSELIKTPLIGKLIPGGSGLRKVRWKSSEGDRGKRGGIRVIYYYASTVRIYMVFAYDKLLDGDLSRQQLKMFSAYVKGLL